VPEHVKDGNRVSVKKFSEFYGAREVSSPSDDKVSQSNAESEAADSFGHDEPAKNITNSILVEAQKELSSSTVGSSNIDQELVKAHSLMKAAVDETFLKDLESLTMSELKIRIVQLASEMNERTKWEAVRLREFLAMKERELGEQ